MPSIIIKEYDKTKSVVSNYANFSVVVPGYCVKNGIFDENGIYECNNQDDFVENIGKVAPTEGISKLPEAPKSVEKQFTKAGSDTAGSFDDFVELVGQPVKPTHTEASVSIIYQRVARNEEQVGYLVDENYKYNKVIAVEETDPEKIPTARFHWDPEGDNIPYNIYVFNDKDTGDYTKIEFTDPVSDSWSATYYAISASNPDNRGNDTVYDYHYGNQIAYQLLGLGYTVLYVNMNGKTIAALGTDDFWSALKDKSIYDFRYIVSGLLGNTHAINTAMVKLAAFVNPTKGSEVSTSNGRGDCTALLDLPKDLYKGLKQSDAVVNIQSFVFADLTDSSVSNSGSYAAYFAPFVNYVGEAIKADYNNSEFPGSFHYLACAAKAAENYNEWYAIAGYTRGISNYNIDAIGCNFGELAVNALEPRFEIEQTLDKAVNLIVKIKGSYYLWGNRTAKKLGEKNSDDLQASHFLNVRQLCSTIKKQVYITCRNRSFDPNSDILWINFCNDIRPTLEKMKADQGITDYKFIKMKTNQKAMLKAKIRIVPIEAVEDFDITLTLENSLAGNVDVDIDEQ